MNAAVALLEKCRALGVSLRLGEDGKLKVSPPPERLPGELVAELRRHKVEIRALLTAQPPPAYRKLYEEMTRAIPEDCHLIDSWLAEAHPALWQRIRDLDDELTRLEQQGAPEAPYRAKLTELVAVCRQAQDLKKGNWGALLIRSEVLGGELVWVVKDEEQARAVLGDGRAIYYADEFQVLKTKSPQQLRDVHKVKLAFPASRVVQ